jgi:hypothetical protein
MDPAALGAFFSGAAAVISALISLRVVRKRCEEDCEKRMDALREGLRLARGEPGAGG